MDAVGLPKGRLSSVLREGGPASITLRGNTTGANAGADPRGARSRSSAICRWDDIERDGAEVRAHCLTEFGEDYTPSH